MRAVIWTDVFQFGVMLAGMLAVLIKVRVIAVIPFHPGVKNINKLLRI